MGKKDSRYQRGWEVESAKRQTEGNIECRGLQRPGALGQDR